MKETAAIYASEMHDITHINTQEEYLKFKREYSKPRTQWTPQDLAERFPEEKRKGSLLTAEQGDRQRVFQFFKKQDVSGNYTGEEYAQEVSRVLFAPNSKGNPFGVLWRDISGYDCDGYLTSYAVVISNTFLEIPLTDRASYQEIYEYKISPNGQKELAKITSTHITKTLDLMPGNRIGQPTVVDFTNVPLER